MGRITSKPTQISSDAAINAVLRDIPQAKVHGPVKFYYNEGEDQFLILEKDLNIPALPVHHPMDNSNPPEGYREAMYTLVSFLAGQCPSLIAGTRWSFDPRSIHTPTFYRVEEYKGQAYLYMVLVDLACRTLESEIVSPGTNDRTPAYRSRHLYFECDYFPLNGLDSDSLVLNQTIPVTWKGESGEGYMVHGIWMDADINKFFSKLILPPGTRNHPYYPVTCKQHCVSMNAFGIESPALLHEIRPYIEGSLDRILEELHKNPFSEKAAVFRELKDKFPAQPGERWKNLRITPSLNERDQKEYTVEF